MAWDITRWNRRWMYSIWLVGVLGWPSVNQKSNQSNWIQATRNPINQIDNIFLFNFKASRKSNSIIQNNIISGLPEQVLGRFLRGGCGWEGLSVRVLIPVLGDQVPKGGDSLIHAAPKIKPKIKNQLKKKLKIQHSLVRLKSIQKNSKKYQNSTLFGLPYTYYKTRIMHKHNKIDHSYVPCLTIIGLYDLCVDS